MSRRQTRRRSYGRRQHELSERRQRSQPTRWAIDDAAAELGADAGGLVGEEYGHHSLGHDFAR